MTRSSGRPSSNPTMASRMVSCAARALQAPVKIIFGCRVPKAALVTPQQDGCSRVCGAKIYAAVIAFERRRIACCSRIVRVDQASRACPAGLDKALAIVAVKGIRERLLHFAGQ